MSVDNLVVFIFQMLKMKQLPLSVLCMEEGTLISSLKRLISNYI